MLLQMALSAELPLALDALEGRGSLVDGLQVHVQVVLVGEPAVALGALEGPDDQWCQDLVAKYFVMGLYYALRSSFKEKRLVQD